MLNSDKWQKLSNMVLDGKFDCAVLVAHNMPRIYELLGKDFLPDVPVISSFAIDFAQDFLAGKHVAVIDAALNVPLFQYVCDKLETIGVASYVCFCLRKHQESRFYQPLRCVSQYGLTDDAYRYYSLTISRAISILNKPYTIEFPELHIEYTKDLPKRLVAAFGDNVHRLDTIDGAPLGFDRFSVDMGEDGRKLRFFVDDITQEAIAVPIVPPNVMCPDTNTVQQRMFLDSWQYGLAWLESLDIAVHGIVKEDAAMLFGDNLAATMTRETPHASEQPYTPLALRKKKIQLGKELIEGYSSHSFEDAFIELFERCNKSTEKYIPDDYTRLLHGFTLPELAAIFNDESYGTVSIVVDRQIDQGYIMPVIDIDGRRVLCKSSAAPYESDIVFLMQSLGNYVSPNNYRSYLYNEMDKDTVQDIFKAIRQ